MDKDCRLDGSEDALAILTSIAPKSAEVTTCGCLGPCGGGPNVEVKDEMGKVSIMKGWSFWRVVYFALDPTFCS